MVSGLAKDDEKEIEITIKNLGFAYGLGRNKHEVFNNIDLLIYRNEFVCLVGPSGCGKSTLLRIIAGFVKPSYGKVMNKDAEIKDVSFTRAVVFQEDAVFPWMTVYTNVEYGLRSRNVPEKIRRDKVIEHLKLVGLADYVNSFPRELSYGMRKRVDIARVLANDPEIILMDEPFGALDAFTKESLQVKLTEIWEKHRKTLLFVTHDLEEALFLGDRIALMKTDPDTPLTMYEVPFNRPRKVELKTDPIFQKMRNNIMEEFRAGDR